MDGNFVHPTYQMDDIICLIRWMGVTQRRINIPMIPVPVISGPTSAQVVGKTKNPMVYFESQIGPIHADEQ